MSKHLEHGFHIQFNNVASANTKIGKNKYAVETKI